MRARVPSLLLLFPPFLALPPFGFTHLCQRYEFRSVSYSRRICTVQIRVNVVVLPSAWTVNRDHNITTVFWEFFFCFFFEGEKGFRFENLSILDSRFEINGLGKILLMLFIYFGTGCSMFELNILGGCFVSYFLGVVRNVSKFGVFLELNVDQILFFIIFGND